MDPRVGGDWLTQLSNLQGIPARMYTYTQCALYRIWCFDAIISTSNEQCAFVTHVASSNGSVMGREEQVKQAMRGEGREKGGEGEKGLLCIWPRPNGPRSPPRLALPQSLSLDASSANLASPDSKLALNSTNRQGHKGYKLVRAFICIIMLAAGKLGYTALLVVCLLLSPVHHPWIE